jgi:hypothetical protein
MPSSPTRKNKPIGNTGSPLVFYLKYMAEMNHLYYPEEYGEPDPMGVDDPEHVRGMARTVGAAASEQVVDFLEHCGKKIEEHFIGLGIATVTSKKKRAAVFSDWFWKVRIWVPSVQDGWFLCGVSVTAPPEVRISLGKDVCGIVMPWLWAKGGHKGEEAIRKILGGWADSRAGEGLVYDKGTIALARIPIKAQPPESFDVDRDNLITEVMKTIARIGAEQTTAIARFVTALKEPEES